MAAQSSSGPIRPDPGDPDEVGPDELDLNALSPLEASGEFADMLLDLQYRGRLSARDVCVLSFYAARGGLRGRAADLAYNPYAQTGKFQRHLDRVLGTLRAIDDDLYSLSVPGYDRFKASRADVIIPAIPPHEVLSQEVDASPDLARQLRDQVSGNEWSQAYHAHPAVTTAPEGTPVYPLALYMDGVSFQRRDSLYCFYAYNLISNVRHLVFTVRKGDCCSCGCLKWCTFFEVFRFLAWSFAAAARGQYPETRHDGTAFGDQERSRAEQAGSPCVRGAVVYIKGDWAEFAHTVGLPTWQNVLNPCYCCWTNRSTLYSLGSMSAVSPPYDRKTDVQYDEACAACEKRVVLETADQCKKLAAALWYDKRKSGNRGRCLRRAFPEWGLSAGDRLEPSAGLPNVGGLEHLNSGFPVEVVFWRRSENTVALHRNPLFCGEN